MNRFLKIFANTKLLLVLTLLCLAGSTSLLYSQTCAFVSNMGFNMIAYNVYQFPGCNGGVGCWNVVCQKPYPNYFTKPGSGCTLMSSDVNFLAGYLCGGDWIG
jgi:hypothetical protein